MINDFFQNIRILPHLPLKTIAILALLICVYLFFVRKKGKMLIGRGLLFFVFFIYLLNPNFAKIISEPKPDIAAILIDQSSSMQASGRMDGAKLAAQRLADSLKNYPNLVTRSIEISNGESGTSIDKALDDIFSDIPNEQIASAVYIGDGQTIEAHKTREFPIHQLLIGTPDEIDRRIEILNAPVSTKVGSAAKYKIKAIQTNGDEKKAKLNIYSGNSAPIEIEVILNRETEIEVPINERGKITIAFEIAAAKGEISKANNAIIHQTIGVAEALKVLLVTGEPYEGARAWRNLLKSDPNIDLVHFTILRGPEDEEDENFSPLSLIPFPTDELFFEHLNSFDLIVFDRFKRLDALPDFYLSRVATWIERGGGFLFLAGPDEIGNNGILGTPLARLMPFFGNASLIDTEFKPSITPTGLLHPITKDFANIQSTWGNWTGAVKYSAKGDVLLSANGAPLLITNQIGKGRISAILSDKSWLWQRGYQNGGPFRALMARIIHWLLKDPELSQEKLSLSVQNANLNISYINTHYNGSLVSIFGPKSQFNLQLIEAPNGSMTQTIQSPDFGLYRAQVNDVDAKLIVGINGETTKDLIATNGIISKYIGNRIGKFAFIGIDGKGILPQFAANSALSFSPNNWQLKQNNFRDKKSIKLSPIIPPVFWAFILSILAIIVWTLEGGSLWQSLRLQNRAKASAPD